MGSVEVGLTGGFCFV